MNFILYLSDFIIPFVVFYVVGTGLLSKVQIYDEFIEGAEDGLKVVVKIVPTLIGLMVAIGILRASGTLDIISQALMPLVKPLLFPAELIPLVIIKMFSSSAATSLLLDIFKEFGPDSFLGRLGAIIMSSTETIFYTMAIYFMTAGVTKTRYTLAGAMVATLTGVVASLIFTNWMF